ncbi:MAG: enoyl-CoA hydratase/isomerase family protein [Chloroflexia bacterium]
MSRYTGIVLERKEEGRVAVITINRPDKLNALNLTVLEELADALDSIQADEVVRAVVVTGAGSKAFVAGADIGEIVALEGEGGGADYARFGQRVFAKVEGLRVPVIMAINGYALGGGCELAMCGDVRIAADSAELGQPETNLGVIPGYGGTQRLARLVGRDRAKMLIFTGARIGAEEALRLGLVDRVVPAEELMEAALTLAKDLAGSAPRAIALAKQAVNQGISLPLDEALELEARLFGQAVATEDRREGASAFMEKRAPEWKGR